MVKIEKRDKEVMVKKFGGKKNGAEPCDKIRGTSKSPESGMNKYSHSHTH